jgi:hypothetical protein
VSLFECCDYYFTLFSGWVLQEDIVKSLKWILSLIMNPTRIVSPFCFLMLKPKKKKTEM